LPLSSCTTRARRSNARGRSSPLVPSNTTAEGVTRPLPSVVGEAGSGAAFVGHFTERRSTVVTGVDGQRFYALTTPRPLASAPGSFRPARSGDRSTLIEWTNAFIDDLDLHYATACVEHVSRVLTDRGLRCVLFTDLGNATSNGIYRRIGYEAVMEVLGYDLA
jgi:hypothetical protein